MSTFPVQHTTPGTAEPEVFTTNLALTGLVEMGCTDHWLHVRYQGEEDYQRFHTDTAREQLEALTAAYNAFQAPFSTFTTIEFMGEPAVLLVTPDTVTLYKTKNGQHYRALSAYWNDPTHSGKAIVRVRRGSSMMNDLATAPLTDGSLGDWKRVYWPSQDAKKDIEPFLTLVTQAKPSGWRAINPDTEFHVRGPR